MRTSVAWPSNPLIEALLALIGLLFLYGFTLSLRALFRIHTERRAARLAVSRRGLIHDQAGLDIHLGSSRARLAGSLLSAMLRQQALAFARPADALEPVLDNAARIAAPARAVPNLLLLFGLIATVVGLAFTLSSLGPQIQGAIDAGDPKLVAQSLGQTLREMSGAFAGTLWGVSGAFLLQAINVINGLQAEHLAADLDTVALQFAPDIYPAGTAQQIASLSEMVRRSEQFLAETQTKISETSGQFAAVLKEAGGVIQTSLTTLDKTSKDISVELQKASGDVRQSSHSLSVAVTAMTLQQSDFHNTYIQFNDMFDQSMKTLKAHADDELEEIRRLQKSFGESGAEIVGAILNTSQLLHELSGDLARGQAANQLGSEGVVTSMKSGFDQLHQRLGETLSTYTTEVNATGSSLDGLRSSLDASQAATALLERTLQAREDAERARADQRWESEQTLLAATARLTTSIEQFGPALVGLQASPGELTEALSARLTTLMGEDRALQDQAEARLLRATLDTNHHLETLLGALGRPVDRAGNAPVTAGQERLNGGSEVRLTGWAGASGQRAGPGTEVETLSSALEQQRESVRELARRLDELPAQLRTAELAQSQTQLTSILLRLLDNLERGVGARLAGEAP